MLKQLKIIFCLLLLGVLSPSITSIALCQLTPEQIAQKVYDRDLGDDMQLVGFMDLISKKGHIRSREFISLRKESNEDRKQLIRFTAPADIKGTSFLTLEKDSNHKTEQHLYLPALKRTRRIVANQKGRSFVNSDFTYEDMQRHPVEEWSYRIEAEEEFSGVPCYILISTPNAGTKTQYSKLMSWIEKEHFIPLKTIFWDKKGKQTKSYLVNKFELIDRIATETDIRMEDLRSGHITRIKNQQITYNTGLKDTLFTTRALER